MRRTPESDERERLAMVRASTEAVETRTVLQAARDEWAPACARGGDAAPGSSPRSDRPVQLAELACQLVATGREIPVRLQRIPSGWWVATVDGIFPYFARGRSLRETRRRLRAELGALVGEDLAGAAVLREHVVLPERVRWQLQEADVQRERAERARWEAAEAMREAALRLRREAGLSLRDAGDILGVSAQQVHRIAPPRRSRSE
jgi:hypothetical protein